MRHVPREMDARVTAAARAFPAVVVTGPRRAGKTWLLRHLFPGTTYRLLEDPDVIARFRADPHGFLDEIDPPVILDEVQNVPEILSYVRSRIDRSPRRTGRYFLTGSQEAGLMKHVAESMAGRAAVLHLWPLSVRESARVSLLHGGYPEVVARPRQAGLWFSSYVQTYLERDVRAITAVHDLSLFRRFMGLVASRHGQYLKRTDLAAPLGLSVPSVNRWLDILDATAQVLIVPPYFENLGKRIVKSPKVYIADSGLACHLLGIETRAELLRSPFRGALFEGFVAGEIVKAQVNAGRRREVYAFRDQTGLEVDLVVPLPGGGIHLIEAKASSTVRPAMADPMRTIAAAYKAHRGPRGAVRATLVHEPTRAPQATRAVAPGVEALPWRDFIAGF
jgi:hypothetical protein